VLQFCLRALGVDSIDSPALDLRHISQYDSVASTPVLFITSPGTDPSQELRDFAHKKLGADHFHEVCPLLAQSYFRLQWGKAKAITPCRCFDNAQSRAIGYV
jgi:hypothetical protein